MGKPTEGPWTACFVLADTVKVAFHIAAKPDGSARPIAVMGPYQGIIERYHWAEGELEANGHLLAAAWDMQAALELARTELIEEGFVESVNPTLIAINAALAKSRGEA